MDINSMSPTSGRLLAEDGSVVNIVDLLNTGTVASISDKVYDIDNYSPRSGRVIGEDGRLYNLVDLLAGGGGGSEPLPSGLLKTKTLDIQPKNITKQTHFEQLHTQEIHEAFHTHRFIYGAGHLDAQHNSVGLIFAHRGFWYTGREYAIPTDINSITRVELWGGWPSPRHTVTLTDAVLVTTNDGLNTSKLIGTFEADGAIFDIQICIGFSYDSPAGTCAYALPHDMSNNAFQSSAIITRRGEDMWGGWLRPNGIFFEGGEGKNDFLAGWDYRINFPSPLNANDRLNLFVHLPVVMDFDEVHTGQPPVHLPFQVNLVLIPVGATGTTESTTPFNPNFGQLPPIHATHTLDINGITLNTRDSEMWIIQNWFGSPYDIKRDIEVISADAITRT